MSEPAYLGPVLAAGESPTKPAREPARDAGPGSGRGSGRGSGSPDERERPSTGAPSSATVRARSAGATVTVAGFWRRLGAAAIDAAVIVPVSLLLTWIASAIASIHLPPGKRGEIDFWLDLALTSDPAVMTAVVIGLAVTMIYLFVFQATIAQTLGMRVLRLRVIDVYGDAPSYPRAGLRTAGCLASLATLMLGFLWIGFDAEKRGLHDWIAGTYVIRI